MNRTLSFLVGLVMFLYAPLALCQTGFFTSGQTCEMGWPTQTSLDDFGVLLRGTSSHPQSVSLFCPLKYSVTAGSSVTIDSANVMVYDSDTSNAISCWVEVVNWDGTEYSSGMQYTCNTGSGSCSSNSGPSFVGADTLTFTDPIATTNLYPIEAGIVCTLTTAANSSCYQRILGYNYTIN